MCEALERIYLEVNGERLARERKEELDKAVAEAVERTRAEQEAYIKELEEKVKELTLGHRCSVIRF